MRCARTFETIEPLERRTLLSTYVVLTGGDGSDVVRPMRHGVIAARTLRAAIDAANANADADVILIRASPHRRIRLSPQKGELTIQSDVTIRGPGANRLTIDAGGAGRAFSVVAGASATISRVTIANGRASRSGGGGVRNLG